MGYDFADRYSLLHFATGVAARLVRMPAPVFVFAITIFELLENSETGMMLINRLPYWPGGKEHADSTLNMVGDILFGFAGWRFGGYLV